MAQTISRVKPIKINIHRLWTGNKKYQSTINKIIDKVEKIKIVDYPYRDLKSISKKRCFMSGQMNILMRVIKLLKKEGD